MPTLGTEAPNTIVDPTTILDLTDRDICDFRTVTKYCVTQDIHEANVRSSIARGYPSIPAATETTYNPIAIVCSGPSLADTWTEVKKFSTIMSCSGAHSFLLDRGVIPSLHLETDPRSHKAEFVKHPHPTVQYLIASCCDPSVFDALTGHDVRIWHVLGNYEERMLPTMYPRGHWLLTGGSNAGLRALVMARVLGFTNIHIFGMDCSSGPETFHANDHPNEPKGKARRTVRVGDRIFVTTEVFLEYARQFFREILMLPDVTFMLHGDGLLQNLAAQKANDPEAIRRRILDVRARANTVSTIALTMAPTISDEYLQIMRKVQEQPVPLSLSLRYVDVVEKLLVSVNPKTVLDYGCGKGVLSERLSVPIWNYEPAITGKDRPPRPADLVLCFDVLQCVEPDYLDAVLMDVARCTLTLAYFVIVLGPSDRVLPDGRNAHLIQQDTEWWRGRLARYFTISDNAVIRRDSTVNIVAGRKGAS